MANWQAKPASCAGCLWENLSNGYACGTGPTNAKLAIIAESLGKNEAEQGIPLVGWTGQQANNFLRNHSVRREEVYIDNIVRCMPPVPGKTVINGKKVKEKIPKQVADFCFERHAKPALQYIKPNVILALGDYSLKQLTGKKGIGKWRGSILHTPEYGKVVPTYHPSFLTKGDTAVIWYPFIDFDFSRAIEESKSPDYEPPTERYNLSPTLQQVKDFYDYVKLHKRVAIDIETSAGSWWNTAILCVGMYCHDRGMAIPLLGKGGEWAWQKWVYPEVIQVINGILSDPTIHKIFQNENYDLQVLASNGFIIDSDYDRSAVTAHTDTMIQHHSVIAEKGVPHDLAFIGSIYTKIPFYKDDVKGEDNFALLDNHVLRLYNCRDNLVTYTAAPELDVEIDEYKVRPTYELDMRMLAPLRRIQRRGLLIDKGLLTYYRKKLEEEILQAEIDLKSVLGQSFNPKSGHQVAKLLFDDLKLEPIGYTKGGLPKTDFETLTLLAEQVDSKLEVLFMILVNWRKAQKQHSTYFKEFILDAFSRLHTALLTHVTPTGRLSSRNPNMQNWNEISDEDKKKGKISPKHLIIAQPGYVLMERDYSQIEIRVFGYIADDELIIDVMEGRALDENGKPIDIHRQNAADLFSVSSSSVNKPQRDFAKTFQYGAIFYGGTASTVRRNALSRAIRMGIPRDGVPSVSEIERSQKSYYGKHPKVVALQARIAEEVMRTRMLRTPLGRVRHFLGKKDNIIRAAYNFPIQGTAADIINTALIALDNCMPEPDGINLQIHDSLLFEIRESELQRYLDLTREVMEAPVNINGRSVVFPTDAKVGKCWGEMESVK